MSFEAVARVLQEELESDLSLLRRHWRLWLADERDVVEFRPFGSEWGYQPLLFLRPDRLHISGSYHLSGDKLEAVSRANKRLDALIGRDRSRRLRRLRPGPLAEVASEVLPSPHAPDGLE